MNNYQSLQKNYKKLNYINNLLKYSNNPKLIKQQTFIVSTILNNYSKYYIENKKSYIGGSTCNIPDDYNNVLNDSQFSDLQEKIRVNLNKIFDIKSKELNLDPIFIILLNLYALDNLSDNEKKQKQNKLKDITTCFFKTEPDGLNVRKTMRTKIIEMIKKPIPFPISSMVTESMLDNAFNTVTGLSFDEVTIIIFHAIIDNTKILNSGVKGIQHFLCEKSNEIITQVQFDCSNLKPTEEEMQSPPPINPIKIEYEDNTKPEKKKI